MKKNDRQSKPRKRLYVYGALMLAVMIFIFVMSAIPGKESQSLSDKFLFFPLVKLIETLRLDRFGWTVSFVIRKCAHMFEFFCLAVTSFLFIGELLLPHPKRLSLTAGASLLWSFIYACTDELHQIFVRDRASRPKDIFIDTVGAVLGVLLMLLISHLCRKRAKT